MFDVVVTYYLLDIVAYKIIDLVPSYIVLQ